MEHLLELDGQPDVLDLGFVMSDFSQPVGKDLRAGANDRVICMNPWIERSSEMSEVRLGIDVACRAAHQASLGDEGGRFLWQGWIFRTVTAEPETFWARIGADVTAVVVMEPTRNAWLPLAAWLQAKGAAVSVVPPGTVA